jgi:peptidoglycan/xylan/chitin deacetylase (PgdA/CDA1 family)
MRAPMVALTLDDGPDPASTPLILSELGRHGARATFFLIAERVRGHDELVRRLVGERHQVGKNINPARPSKPHHD